MPQCYRIGGSQALSASRRTMANKNNESEHDDSKQDGGENTPTEYAETTPARCSHHGRPTLAPPSLQCRHFIIFLHRFTVRRGFLRGLDYGIVCFVRGRQQRLELFARLARFVAFSP